MNQTVPSKNPYRAVFSISILWIFLFVVHSSVFAGEQLIIQLKDFDAAEVKCGGFSLSADAQVHIRAQGGGSDKHRDNSDNGMFAYGWIIDADRRELVWKMDYDDTRKGSNDDRIFDDEVSLTKGNYEVYFTAYAFAGSSFFSNFFINIDRRHTIENPKKKEGPWPWDFFKDHDLAKEWKKRAKNWGIELYVSTETRGRATMFSAPRELPNVLFKAVRLGENAHVRQRFVISEPMSVRVYAFGESDASRELADYGWIVEDKSRRRVWEMGHREFEYAGGAEKNVKFDGVVHFSPGEYTLYYNTDDSHSYVDWNAAPPDDPFNYGITLCAVKGSEKDRFKLAAPQVEQNVILQLTKIGDDETRSATFGLKAEAQLRIYALGERQNSRREMADYGWIVNAKTRERVWEMDVDHTEHAGGAEKNRVIDEIITLPKGTYTLYYRTDDSHAYDSWNSAAPFDPEHWGITLYGVGERFDRSKIETNIKSAAKEAGVITQIIRVGDDANKSAVFRIAKPTRVRIYALGEGQNREMYDYGWIENTQTHTTVWEMTYGMTFHAGGGRKNRMVNTTVMLDRGTYELHYVTDDSHSYDDWNTDPPDDPTMWGISVYEAGEDSE